MIPAFIARPPAEVEAYLHRHIPIASAMGVRVKTCDGAGVVLTAPLAANVNHRATVFGGSASAVAILAAWTWLHFALRDAGLACRVVIQRNEMDYQLPIDGDFAAYCSGLEKSALEKLLRSQRRYGKGRVALAAELRLSDRRVATFGGDYVAVRLD